MTLARSSLQRQFICGALAGVLVTICVFAGGALLVAQRGVRVDVDIEPIAIMARQQVTDEAQRSLPQMLSEIESRVPEMVAAQMVERMTGAATINLADFTFELPDSMTKLIQERIQAIVEDIIYECFSEFDTDFAAAQLGDQAYELVKTSIAAEASEAALKYRLFGRVPVPVTLTFR